MLHPTDHRLKAIPRPFILGIMYSFSEGNRGLSTKKIELTWGTAIAMNDVEVVKAHIVSENFDREISI